MDITFIVWTLLTGIGAAIVYLWYQRRFVGDFVRKLLTIDAVSPETAEDFFKNEVLTRV